MAPGPAVQIIRQADLALVPWRNGKGLTRDIVTRTDDSGALVWQLGLAELTEDADFSDFSGCDRLFTPLHPVELGFDGGAWLPCPALLPVAFAGERRTRLRLPHGPARAFNVITARILGPAHVGAVQLPCGGSLTAGFAGVGVIHCVEGIVHLSGGERLHPGDTALAGPGWQGDLAAPGGAKLLMAAIGAAAAFPTTP